MPKEQAIAEGSSRLWEKMLEEAEMRGWTPIAVIGSKKIGGKFYAAISRAHALPKHVLLKVLKQIVSELAREEQSDGQRVS